MSFLVWASAAPGPSTLIEILIWAVAICKKHNSLVEKSFGRVDDIVVLKMKGFGRWCLFLAKFHSTNNINPEVDRKLF